MYASPSPAEHPDIKSEDSLGSPDWTPPRRGGAPPRVKEEDSDIKLEPPERASTSKRRRQTESSKTAIKQEVLAQADAVPAGQHTDVSAASNHIQPHNHPHGSEATHNHVKAESSPSHMTPTSAASRQRKRVGSSPHIAPEVELVDITEDLHLDDAAGDDDDDDLVFVKEETVEELERQMAAKAQQEISRLQREQLQEKYDQAVHRKEQVCRLQK